MYDEQNKPTNGFTTIQYDKLSKSSRGCVLEKGEMNGDDDLSSLVIVVNNFQHKFEKIRHCCTIALEIIQLCYQN